MHPQRFLAAISLLLALSLPSFAAEITAEASENGAVIKIDGRLFAEYVTKSGNKPIVWPIIGPTGKPMTRDYPMRETAGEKQDHPHQRSMWFTHGNVNGVNFWAESQKQVKKMPVGAIEHVKFLKIAGGKPAIVATENKWVDPKGKIICEDERTLRFDTDGSARWIDFDITVKATNGPVNFADDKEGSFGVRVAESISVDGKQGGKIVNSDGKVGKAAWGQRAAWVDAYGPVDGKIVGVAIFNHPTSFRFPAYWHARTYGLFGANPFGVSKFTYGKQPSGEYTIPAGESITLRHRVFLHAGDAKAGKVAEAYDYYTKDVK